MDTRLTASEANRIFYRDYAEEYERSEACLVDPEEQRRFRAALGRALAMVSPEPKVLDACGGTGNAGVALAAQGVTPVVVDISPEMVEIWRRKAERLGLDPEIHVADVAQFLESDGRAWDLVTFCSALHHLEDYLDVAGAAAAHLAPGGAIFTMFDPTPATPAIRALRTVDWRLYMLLFHPRQFIALARDAIRRRGAGDAEGQRVGQMAERHAVTGVDDAALRQRLEAEGLEVRVHERYFGARLKPVEMLLRLLRRPSSFHLVAQRPPTP